jgi:spermidine dehydrogenase
MFNSKPNESGDAALGLNTPIERRDLLNSTLLAAGSMLLSSIAPFQLLAEEDWTGYGGVGDYARSNGNTYEVMTDGHKIRDHVYERASTDAVDTGEEYDCVIVGGGISGLAAALFFQREGGANRTCLVLENHPIFGGEAKRNEFNVDGQRLTAHQGSAACFPPLPGTFFETFYKSIGVDWSQFR